MSLRETIIHTIRDRGAISFHDFMEMALYHPCGGYYTHDVEDRNTSIDSRRECFSLMGWLLARQLEEMWNLLDKPVFTIVECGAGNGYLCREIFRYFREKPSLYPHLHYCIVEQCDPLKKRAQQQVCMEAEWFDSIDHIPYEPDCILLYEMINRLAVHEVVMQKELMEIFVDHRNGFIETARPACDELKEHLAEMKVTLPPGYRTEINMDALDWLRRNAEALHKGFLLTIGNGFRADEYFSLSRCRGNLVCDDLAPDPQHLYETAGERPIRSRTTFTALHHWGKRLGLECCGFTSQAHFLHGMGLLSALGELFPCTSTCKEKITQLYRNIMRFSTHFNILIQQKGLHQPQLAGLQFAKSEV